jgi:acetyltransferase-like isoleucine patch superfamily enzyme
LSNTPTAPARDHRNKLQDHPLWRQCKIADGDVYVSDMARVRGRLNVISIAEHASIADFVVIVSDAPLEIGRNVKVDTHAVLKSHAPLRICANAKVGPGAQLLTGAYDETGIFYKGPIVVGTGAIIGPGAIVLPGTTIEAGQYVRPLSVIGE